MMTATSYLGTIIALQAWPVYAILRSRQLGPIPGRELTVLAVSLGVALLISIIATVLPLRLAVRRIEEMES
jgi:hypothetical protein